MSPECVSRPTVLRHLYANSAPLIKQLLPIHSQEQRWVQVLYGLQVYKIGSSSLRKIVQDYKYKIRPRVWECGVVKVKLQKLRV